MTLPTRLRILHVEDDPQDAELIHETMRRHGVEFDLTHVDSRPAFEKALGEGGWDLILTDFKLPSFDGLTVLELTRAQLPHIPFIFVSGTIGEAAAIETLKKGATDYVLKGHLTRLVPSINRALREAEEHRLLRQAEQHLRDSEERFRSIVETSAEWIWAHDIEGNWTYCNPAVKEVLGYSPVEMLGRHWREFMVEDHVEERRRELAQCIKQKRGWRNATLRWKRKDGTLRILECNANPILDAEGRLTGFRGSQWDVTEKRKLEERLLRAQRLESIGTLASGVSHDLNNVFGPMMMSLEVFRKRLKDEGSQRLLDSLQVAVRRGADLVKQIMSFVRGMEGKQALIQLNHVAREVEKIAKDTFPSTIRIKRNLATDLWTIRADATQMHQILMNLCVNARDAMPDGGDLSLTAENHPIDDGNKEQYPEAGVGDYVCISVSDTGTGMSADVVARIFEPFFTTKEEGKGTGLGLYTVSNIVKNHAGFCRVSSEKGKGSCFRIHLPALRDVRHAEAEVETTDAFVGNGEGIMVADDEVTICEITKEILEIHGYKVCVAADGTEVVRLFAQRPEDFRLLLLDMVMPYMDGGSTARAVQKMSPNTKVIAMSGYSSKEEVVKRGLGALMASHVMLKKPFTAHQLLQLVHGTLHPVAKAAS